MIVGVQDVYYYVRDMARAAAFYRDVLGLRPTVESEHWTAFDVGGVRLGLHKSERSSGLSPAGGNGTEAGATVTLRVQDIHGTIERLRKRGVTFLGDLLDEDYGALIAFMDTEGNVLKLMEPKR